MGVPLTADKGAWTPKASLAYQWVVGGTEVAGATSKSFTPRPQDLGQPVTVEIMASRPGYLTALVTSQPTAATLPGVFHSTKAPEITGRPMVGHTLHASSGSWSLDGVTLSYQWYAGASPIKGATEASYQPTADEAGQPIHVVVTASSAGYTSESATSTDTDRVLLGVADLAKPTAQRQGRARPHAHRPRRDVLTRLGHAALPLDARPASRSVAPTARRTPSGAATSATPSTSRSRCARCTGCRSTGRSLGSAQVRTVPVLHVHTSIRNGRVFLRLRVVSPGLAAAPGGSARALRHHAQLGRFAVVDGRGGRLLAPMRAGTHHDHRALPRRCDGDHRPDHGAGHDPLSSPQRTSNLIPAAWRRAVRWSPIACAVVTWPAVGGLSSKARLSADSASIFAVSS